MWYHPGATNNHDYRYQTTKVKNCVNLSWYTSLFTVVTKQIGQTIDDVIRHASVKLSDRARGFISVIGPMPYEIPIR